MKITKTTIIHIPDIPIVAHWFLSTLQKYGKSITHAHLDCLIEKEKLSYKNHLLKRYSNIENRLDIVLRTKKGYFPDLASVIDSTLYFDWWDKVNRAEEIVEITEENLEELLSWFLDDFKIVRKIFTVRFSIVNKEHESYYNPFKHAPKSFTHWYWSKHRQKEKSALNRELKGLEAIYPYNHKHSIIVENIKRL